MNVLQVLDFRFIVATYRSRVACKERNMVGFWGLRSHRPNLTTANGRPVMTLATLSRASDAKRDYERDYRRLLREPEEKRLNHYVTASRSASQIRLCPGAAEPTGSLTILGMRMKRVEWWKSRKEMGRPGADETILRCCGVVPHKWLAFSRIGMDSHVALRLFSARS